jgi:DNA-binding transcriptional ArsR family regulator
MTQIEGATAMQARPEPIDQRLVRALAHPLRVQILEILTERVASPNRLASELDAGLSHVAYHTRALDEFGCLELVDTAQRRGATEHFYKALPCAFVGNMEWRKVPRSLRSAVTVATLQTFIDKVAVALKAGRMDRDDTVFTWFPLLLDDEGWEEVNACMKEAVDRAQQAQARSTERLSRAGAMKKASSAIVGVAHFETGGSRKM